MKTVTEDAGIELVSLIHSINKDPQSWENWRCLHINLPELSIYSEDLQVIDCMKPLLESCLKDIEGNSFFCEQNDIFIICKNISHNILQEIGQHACDLIFDGNTLSSYYKIFDLTHDGQEFVDYYCKQNERFTIFSLPQIATKREYVESEKAFSPQEEKITQSPEHRKTPKVLLVEDDPVTRWMVRNTLRNECDFATAQNGNKALSLYASYQPDVVFLDINLPDRDGHSVLKWIMRRDPGAYVVMFSGESHLDNIVGTLEDGAKGFIAKPFHKNQLLHYIDRCPNVH
ncbi:MAG: hypothetical protein COB36_07945 [Alphaproteobacteria bacterium]|nr:MAG: hypothetical protein COB36_07945 [Alphaproteobacteria bacterium]